MSKNKFIGDKEKLSIIEEGLKADLSFFMDFNHFLGECIAIASLLGKYQFKHGVDLNNGLLIEDDLESFKRENGKTMAFIFEVTTNNNLTNAYDQRLAIADNKIANIINEMVFKEGGIAHVNGMNNVYFSTEVDKTIKTYSFPTAPNTNPPESRITLDDYLKMEDLMPPNLKAAINQPKVNLENQRQLLQNLLNDAALTPEQRDQLNKQLSNISATLNNPNLKAIDLIYQNATWGKQLISENHQKYGMLYLVIDSLWNAASIGIGLFTCGIGTAIMAGIDIASAGYQYTMLNTTGRNLVTGEIATGAEYKAATINLIAEGVGLVGGHLINKTIPVGKSIANQLSETKLGQRLMSSEAYRVYTHAKDQLGITVKPVVDKIQKTIDEIKLGITKPIVSGLDKLENFFGDIAKKYDDLIPIKEYNSPCIDTIISEANSNKFSNVITQADVVAYNKRPKSVYAGVNDYIEQTDTELTIVHGAHTTKHEIYTGNYIIEITKENSFEGNLFRDKIIKNNLGAEFILAENCLILDVDATNVSLPLLIEEKEFIAVYSYKQAEIHQITYYNNGRIVAQVDFADPFAGQKINPRYHWHLFCCFLEDGKIVWDKIPAHFVGNVDCNTFSNPDQHIKIT